MINPILLKDGGGGEEGGTQSLKAQIWYYFLKVRKVSISSLANSQSSTWKQDAEQLIYTNLQKDKYKFICRKNTKNRSRKVLY